MSNGINKQVLQTGGGEGTGDVVGPASSTDNAIVRFDSTTGKLIQNSSATISDAGLLSTDSATLTTRLNTPEIRATNSAGVDIHNSSGTQVALFGAGGSTGTSLIGTTNIGSSSADYHQVSGGTGTITDTAVGSSTNIDINLVPKGTGKLKVNGTEVALGGGTVTGTSSGTNTGDQNLFSTIAVSGQPDIVADSTTDTLTLVAGSNITITTDATTDAITINSSGGGGFTWNEVTGTSATMAVDNGYIANNASLVTLTLPTTAAVGKVVRVTGKGAGGWKIAQNASEIIHFGSVDTATGTSGYLASSLTRDSIELICIVADTEWNVISSVGNISIN